MARQQSQNKPIRQDGLFSKKIVRQVLGVVNMFTIAVLLVSFFTGGTALDTLIKEWFSFFRYEVLALAGITISKNVTGALQELAEAKKGKKDDYNSFG